MEKNSSLLIKLYSITAICLVVTLFLILFVLNSYTLTGSEYQKIHNPENGVKVQNP